MMKILFGHKAAHAQYIVSFGYPQFLKIFRIVRVVQNYFSHHPPFVPVIIGAMMGEYHFQSQHLSIRHK